MNDTTSDDPGPATAFFKDRTNQRWLATAGVLTIGMIVGGYLLGDGMLRAYESERSVTVRGLAEKDVTADLATWTIAYSATALALVISASWYLKRCKLVVALPSETA